MRPTENAGSVSSGLHDAHPAKSQVNGVVGGHLANGASARPRDYQNAPEEPLQLVEVDHYLPMATLVSRSAQTCWDDLYEMVEHLSTIEIPTKTAEGPRLPGYTPTVNDQTKSNLDKKDRILNFANDSKANLIKLLVLLQWSKGVKDVSKTISLNFWLHQLREQYNLACFDLYMLKTEATEWQLPNPDIGTAGEVLARGKVPSLPHLGYRPLGKLSKKQILSTLRRLNNLLAFRLALDEDIPVFFRDYHVHDGRVTFRVATEFEVDVSVLGATSEAKYQMVDLKFLFTPRPNISEPLRMQLEGLINAELNSNGLSGCYSFLHELSLTSKLTEYYKQAIDMSRRQFAGQLRVELLHRNLIVRYWTERPIAKSWIEIGIYSQKAPSNLPNTTSSIGVRWFREGKRVEDFEIQLDPQNVSLSSILSQITAQHASHILGLIYDKLCPSALFSSGALTLDESTSCSRPEECSLEIQTTRDTKTVISIDPVTGSMVVSPASEKANRLQLEFNRSKNLVDEFVPKFLNFRCAVAEALILSAVKDTLWTTLAAYKPTMADLRALFGPSASRANFFRHPMWSQSYLLAIIYRPSGDALTIVELPAGSTALISARMVHTQIIQPTDDLSPTFFDNYAQYASGVVSLDNLSQHFRQISCRHELSALPDFTAQYKLPAIRFETRRPSGTGSSSSSVNNMAKVRFVSTGLSRRRGPISVQFQSKAPEEVLRQLQVSSQATALNFTFRNGQITLYPDYEHGKTHASDIIEHVRHLMDVIACAQLVDKFKWLRLVSVSVQAVMLAYTFEDSIEREVRIHFRSACTPAKVEFFPQTSNPHAILGPAMAHELQDPRQPFALELEKAMASLRMINPTLLCIYDLQQSMGNGQRSSTRNGVNIHVLVRQPTSLALQFFAADSKKQDENLTTTNSRLLARFDILPSSNFAKPCFVLRPAQEELRSYKRLSFASDAMRAKVKERFFQVDDTSKDFMRLDTSAAFLADRPKPLLEALFNLMAEFAQDPSLSIKEEAVDEAGKTNQPPPPVNVKPNGNAPQKAVPKTPQQGQRNMPNGGVQMQRSKSNKPQMNAKAQEVIELD